MKNKLVFSLLVGFLIVFVVVGGGKMWDLRGDLLLLGLTANAGGDLTVGDDLTVTDDCTISGDLTVNGTAYVDTLSVDEVLFETKGTTSLTSPSVAVDLAGVTWMEITSDANQTGLTLSNGVVGQVYLITTGAGSNTIQFDDDGLNLALGGNIVLTEGQADSIILLCYATGDFLCLSDRSGN